MNYILNYQTWKRLFEQAESEKSTYGKYNFGGTFEANYIMPSKDKKDLAGKTYNDYLKQMVDDLNKEVSENGKKLTEIKITIRSSASSTPATNGYSLQTPPNHTFGGLLPKTGWVKKDAKEYVAIPNGNEFLAKNRGIEMKKVLVADLAAAEVPVPDANIQLLPREDGKWVSDSTDPAEQYVKVEIVGALKKDIPPKEDEPKIKYPYALSINTYTINDNADYVLLSPVAAWGIGSPTVLDTDSKNNGNKLSVEQAETLAKKEFDEYYKTVVKDGNQYSLDLLLKTNGRRTVIGNSVDHSFKAFIKIENYAAKENGVYYFNDYNEWLKQSQKGYFGEGGIGSNTQNYLAGTVTITGNSVMVDDQPERSEKIRNDNIKNYGVPYTRGIINWKATSNKAEGAGTSGVDAKGTTYSIKEIKGGQVTQLNQLSDKTKSAVPSLK